MKLPIIRLQETTYWFTSTGISKQCFKPCNSSTFYSTFVLELKATAYQGNTTFCW